MGRNTQKGYRIGSVVDRTQFVHPMTGTYAKRDTTTGQIMSVKQSPAPYKGVAKEIDGRRR